MPQNNKNQSVSLFTNNNVSNSSNTNKTEIKESSANNNNNSSGSIVSSSENDKKNTSLVNDSNPFLQKAKPAQNLFSSGSITSHTNSGSLFSNNTNSITGSNPNTNSNTFMVNPEKKNIIGNTANVSNFGMNLFSSKFKIIIFYLIYLYR